MRDAELRLAALLFAVLLLAGLALLLFSWAETVDSRAPSELCAVRDFPPACASVR